MEGEPKSIPVYTFGDGVEECFCEKLGWPNVTHDGRLMYENTFFADREVAIETGLRHAEHAIEWRRERVESCRQELEVAHRKLEAAEANLAKFRELAASLSAPVSEGVG